MTIYGWFSNSDYAGVRGVSRRDRRATRFNQSVPEADEIIELEAVSESNRPLGDFPNTGLAFPKCLSRRAFSALESLLAATGTLRRVQISELEYWLYWPEKTVDCLNYAASSITRMPSGYEQLISPVFKENVAEAGPIFLVSQFPTHVLFVTEEFLRIARDAGLQGLELRVGGGADATITRVG